jgi:hypothetical protein
MSSFAGLHFAGRLCDIVFGDTQWPSQGCGLATTGVRVLWSVAGTSRALHCNSQHAEQAADVTRKRLQGLSQCFGASLTRCKRLGWCVYRLKLLVHEDAHLQ